MNYLMRLLVHLGPRVEQHVKRRIGHEMLWTKSLELVLNRQYHYGGRELSKSPTN
jgi:hypothetical protein